MLLTILAVVVYLVGIPFAAGMLGNKWSRTDWFFACFIGAFSWFAVALFVIVLGACAISQRVYRAGLWLNDRIDDIFMD